MSLEQVRLFLQDASKPLAARFGVSKLPENAHLVVASALFFWTVQIVFAPIASKLLVPSSYNKLKGRSGRNNWNIRVVSLVHALIILPLSVRNLNSPNLDADRAFGWEEQYGYTASVACGYFLWDILESTIHFSDVGFVIHALACFFIYFLSFSPFIAFYGPRFLLWELSTPFLNIVWFLDKMGKTGSTAQTAAGILLIVTFAGTRLVYGSLQSINFYYTMSAIKGKAPLTVILVYTIGNVILNGLNIFWFTKMIASVRKRSVAKPETKEVKSR